MTAFRGIYDCPELTNSFQTCLVRTVPLPRSWVVSGVGQLPSQLFIDRFVI